MTKRNNRVAFVLLFAVCFFICLLGLSARAQRVSSDSSGIADVYTDEILDKANISLYEDDSVIRTEGDGFVALTIVRAYDVEIDNCGEIVRVRCAEGTVADALAKAGITDVDGLRVTPSPETKLTSDCKITVTSGSGVTLNIDGTRENFVTSADTVEAFLEEKQITLGEDDIVTPELTESIYEGISITVSRVEIKEEMTTEIIDYGFVTEETSSLASGTSKIKQYGIEGERTIVSKNKYIDGELAESVVVSEEITREPVDQIKLIGTGRQGSSNKPSSNGASVDNASGSFVDASGNTVYYKKKLTGTSTAYYAAEGAITATGTPVYVGGVAVNPYVIPYGSKLYIVSSDGKMVYGYATAVDTGGALMSGSVLVDVFYPTYNECINWGRRNVTVYVLS